MYLAFASQEICACILKLKILIARHKEMHWVDYSLEIVDMASRFQRPLDMYYYMKSHPYLHSRPPVGNHQSVLAIYNGAVVVVGGNGLKSGCDKLSQYLYTYFGDNQEVTSYLLSELTFYEYTSMSF